MGWVDRAWNFDVSQVSTTVSLRECQRKGATGLSEIAELLTGDDLVVMKDFKPKMKKLDT